MSWRAFYLTMGASAALGALLGYSYGLHLGESRPLVIDPTEYALAASGVRL